jgi:DNA recombination protein RmuC
MQKIGDRLRQAQESYDGARRKLIDGKGNLVRQAEQLRGMGIKSRKALPRIGDDELVDAVGGECDNDAVPAGTRHLDRNGANAA